MSNFFSNIFYYLKANKLFSLLGLYFMVSILVKLFFGIDACIPCIWNVIFGIDCPGCGLTSAFIHLLQFKFILAYKSNCLIYVVLPFAGYYLINDYIRFKNKIVS